jgi:hypothetical protein
VREVSSAFVEIWVGRFYVRSRLLKGWLKVYERPVDIFAHQVFARLSAGDAGCASKARRFHASRRLDLRDQIRRLVKFTEWTRDGRLRQPVFLGLREDKNASEVILGQDSAAIS